MGVERSVVLSFAAAIKAEVVNSAIVSLQEMKDCLQSGDDSGLENVWEELCVQVQGEQSAFYSMYEDIVDSYIASSISSLPTYSRLALWLSTDVGAEWSCEHDEDEHPPVCDQETIDEMRSIVLSEAADFENDRIYRYKWGLEEEDEEEENPNAEIEQPEVQACMFSEPPVSSAERIDAEEAVRCLSEDFGPDFIKMICDIAANRATEVVKEMLSQKT